MNIYKFLLLLAFSFLTALGQYMPEGFEDVEIGMSHEALMKVRPNLEPFSLGFKNRGITDGKGMLMESFPHGSPNEEVTKMVIYTFENNKLNGINFTNKTNYSSGFLDKIFQALGQEFNVDYALTANDGVLKWDWKSGQSLITIPFDFENNITTIAYQVLDSSMVEKIKLTSKDRSKIKSNSLAFEGFKKRITAYAEAVLAEVEEQAEVTDAALKDTVKSKGEGPGQEGEYAETNYSESATQGLERSAIYLLLAFGVLVGGVLLLRCFK